MSDELSVPTRVFLAVCGILYAVWLITTMHEVFG